jgi:hypothetical protein
MAAPIETEHGFALTFVLVTFMLVAVIGLGALSVVMSDLHGAVANQLAMQSLSAAEAGLNYGVAQLTTRAADATPSDDAYAGESDDLAVPAPIGTPSGTFRVIVRCAYPEGAVPPACQDDPRTVATDEHNLRVITSTGFVPGRPERARRQVEATVQRYTAGHGDLNIYGICGRERVELGQDTSVTADVGSNGDIIVNGAEDGRRTVRLRIPRAPLLTPTVEVTSPEGQEVGLSGTYSWRVTFLNGRGEESGGSPPTPPVFLASQRAHLTNIPTGDTTAERRRIYRSPQDSPRGPWFLVGEIADSDTQEFTDVQPDEVLRIRIPGAINGNLTAAGGVFCSRACGSQVEGRIASGVHDVVCPAFLAPPVRPGTKPAPNPIVQTVTNQTVNWTSLHVGEDEVFTIQTLSTLDAQLHIHLTDVILERGAALAVTGPGTVYLHVSGVFILHRDAMFGVTDFSGQLIRPSDRVQILVGARDPSLLETGAASVRWEGGNRVSALVFAPNANIVVDRAAAVGGALYGKSVRLVQSSGITLDPVEGMGSEKSAVRQTPFQYVTRWYDNPNLNPSP